MHINKRGLITSSNRKIQTSTFAPSTQSATPSEKSSPQKKGGKGIDAGQGGRFTKKGEDGEPSDIDADIVVIATGFKQPTVDFLPADLFPEGYARPNLYLQNFSTEDWSVCLTNAAYKNAIGTV